MCQILKETMLDLNESRIQSNENKAEGYNRTEYSISLHSSN